MNAGRALIAVCAMLGAPEAHSRVSRMTHQFDEETRLQPGPDGRWTGRVHPAWNIGANPNGGYLMSLAMSAMGRLVPQHPDPLSITAHYLRPGSAGVDCEVEATVIRSGRSLTTARATLVQEGKPRLEVLAAHEVDVDDLVGNALLGELQAHLLGADRDVVMVEPEQGASPFGAGLCRVRRPQFGPASARSRGIATGIRAVAD